MREAYRAQFAKGVRFGDDAASNNDHGLRFHWVRQVGRGAKLRERRLQRAFLCPTEEPRDVRYNLINGQRVFVEL